jgi:glutamate synthase (NADH)
MGLAVEETYRQDITNNEQQEEYTPYQPEKGKGYGWAEALPQRQGLYDPALEKDACGVGFAAYVSRFLVAFALLICPQPHQG